MKRIVLFLLFNLVLCLPGLGKDFDWEKSVRKAAKKMQKQGWVMVSPSQMSLADGILWHLEKAYQRDDKFNPTFLMSSETTISSSFEVAMERAKNVCYAHLAADMKSEVKSMAEERTFLENFGEGSKHHSEFVQQINVIADECLRNVEPSLILYRKTKIGYEVSATYMVNVEKLHQQR